MSRLPIANCRIPIDSVSTRHLNRQLEIGNRQFTASPLDTQSGFVAMLSRVGLPLE